MIKHEPEPIFFIFLTLFLAVLLSLLPIPRALVWWSPCWVLLALIYWQLYSKKNGGMGVAFLMGLILDASMGTLLGEHALALVIPSYALLRFQQSVRLASMLQKSFLVFFLCLAYCTIILIAEACQGHVRGQWFFWFPALSSALIWPTLSQLLHYFSHRKRK